MRIIFYNKAGVFFVSARLPCLPACVPAAWPAWPACLAWPGLGLACWLAWLPGCKECTAQKHEAGTPYRCTQCCLWHATALFVSKHKKSTVESAQSLLIVWCNETMFCLHEEAHKRIFHCASMESKQAREEGMPALSKKGKWKRARCHQKMPAQQFSHYSKMPGEDGLMLVVTLSCPCRASDSP